MRLLRENHKKFPKSCKDSGSTHSGPMQPCCYLWVLHWILRRRRHLNKLTIHISALLQVQAYTDIRVNTKSRVRHLSRQACTSGKNHSKISNLNCTLPWRLEQKPCAVSHIVQAHAKTTCAMNKTSPSPETSKVGKPALCLCTIYKGGDLIILIPRECTCPRKHSCQLKRVLYCLLSSPENTKDARALSIKCQEPFDVNAVRLSEGGREIHFSPTWT